MAVALGVSGTLFGRRVALLVRLARQAQPVSRAGDIPTRVEHEATIVLGQRKLLKRLGPGLMHAFIFWGFLVLGPTIVIAAPAMGARPPRSGPRQRPGPAAAGVGAA